MRGNPAREATHVNVTLINETKGYRFSEFREELEGGETPGEVFRRARAEYGRCEGKVYIDRADGTVDMIGWTFRKRVRYDDCKEYYVREAWITLVCVTPEKVRSIPLGKG